MRETVNCTSAFSDVVCTWDLTAVHSRLHSCSSLASQEVCMSLEWGCQPISKENSLKASLVTEEHPFDPPAADRILGLGEGLGFGERGSLSSGV